MLFQSVFLIDNIMKNVSISFLYIFQFRFVEFIYHMNQRMTIFIYLNK